jgi:hypothetical protein
MMQRSALDSLKRPPNGTSIGRRNSPFQLRVKNSDPCSVKGIGGFLKVLEVQKGIEPWQVDQARKALIFLYRDFFKLNLRVPESTAKTKGKLSELMGLKGGRPSWMMGRGEWDVHL